LPNGAGGSDTVVTSQPDARSTVRRGALLRKRPCDTDHADQPQRSLPGDPVRFHAGIHSRSRYENNDHNPQRIDPRNLFDAAVGHDNIFHTDKYKWSARLTVVNLTNKEALYNFLSDVQRDPLCFAAPLFAITEWATKPRTLPVSTGALGVLFQPDCGRAAIL
jgi:hypothetical protein